MDIITGEVITTQSISGDVLLTQEISGNVNLPTSCGATTWQELTLKPFETLYTGDFYVDENGVLHVIGSGTSSNAVWYPSVSDGGDISWEKIDSETAPTAKNIKGPKGDKGDTGEQGIQGIQGIQGLQGIQGIQGEKGDKGDTGEQGIQGIQGVKGDKGDTGEKGADGINGTNGADGKSAYEVAVLNGYVGTQSEWLLSLKGEQGATGAQGEQGIQGTAGTNGTDGKSAYQSAIDGGFTGTESEFNTKLATAEQNVQSDWSQTDTNADDYIKNKPTIPEAYTLPQATETTLGGIKAKAKTTETVECAIDTATGKLYVPESGGGMITETIAAYQLTITNGTTKTNADRLQGKAISATAPTTGQAMCYNGAQWTPKSLGAATLIASGSLSQGTPVNYSQSANNFRYIAYVLSGGISGEDYENGEVGFLPVGALPVSINTLKVGPSSSNGIRTVSLSSTAAASSSGIYTPCSIKVWGVS